jgi:hypothetical protein
MSIKTKFDAVAARKYQTIDGVEKTQWINVGRAVEWDNGDIEIELNSIPAGSWWNGKIKLFEQKSKTQSATKSSQQMTHSQDDF